MSRTILTGNLRSLSVSDLFQLLRFKRDTVVMSFSTVSSSIDFFVEQGMIIWATSVGEKEPIGAYLVRVGALTNEELMIQLSKKEVGGDGELLGRYLISNGIVTEDQVQQALRSRILDLTIKVMQMSEADVLVTQAETEPRGNLEHPISIDYLMLESARRMDEESSIQEFVSSLDEPLELQPQNLADDVEFSEREWENLKLIDGISTINNIISLSNQSREDVLKSMAAFFSLKIVKVVKTDNVKPRILVVDDSLTSRHLVTYILSNSGFNVVEAGDGHTALAKVEAERPDLLVLDVMLPGISGYEVCTQLKKNEKFTDIPVILLTSLTGFTDKIRGKLAKADVYLTKPVKEEELVSVVEHLLKKHR
ncbi:response regulator [bacterium]|nr:response regulator [bacterium]